MKPMTDSTTRWGWSGQVSLAGRLSGKWLFDAATAPARLRNYRYPTDFSDWQETAVALLVAEAQHAPTILLPDWPDLSDDVERAAMCAAQEGQRQVCAGSEPAAQSVSLLKVKRGLFGGRLSLFALQCPTCMTTSPQIAYFYSILLPSADAEPTLLTDDSSKTLLYTLLDCDKRIAQAYRLDPQQIVDCRVTAWRRRARQMVTAADDLVSLRFIDTGGRETLRRDFSRVLLRALPYFRMITDRHSESSVLTIEENGFDATHILLWCEAKLLSQLANSDADNEDLRARFIEEMRRTAPSADNHQSMICTYGADALDRARYFLGLDEHEQHATT